MKEIHITQSVTMGRTFMKKNNIMVLLCAKWLTTFGAYLQSVVLPIILFNATGSSQLLSLTFIAETLPWLIVPPVLAPYIYSKLSVKQSYIICNFVRAILVFLLAFIINNSIFVVLIFLLLGITNSLASPLYSILMKANTTDSDLNKMLGVSLGVDDIISVLAPILVTLALNANVKIIFFIYANASILLITAILSFGLPYTVSTQYSSVQLSMKKKHIILDELKSLKNSSISFLIISESARSFAEGMCIPLFISYVTTIIKAEEKLFTIGETTNAISQVVMSFIYIFLSSKLSHNQIINLGATLIALSYSFMIFVSKPGAYLFAMILIGMGMSIRQLVAENELMSTYNENLLFSKISIYNSIIAITYLFGYFVSAIQTYIFSIKFMFILGALLIIFPFIRYLLNKKENLNDPKPDI